MANVMAATGQVVHSLEWVRAQPIEELAQKMNTKSNEIVSDIAAEILKTPKEVIDIDSVCLLIAVLQPQALKTKVKIVLQQSLDGIVPSSDIPKLFTSLEIACLEKNEQEGLRLLLEGSDLPDDEECLAQLMLWTCKSPHARNFAWLLLENITRRQVKEYTVFDSFLDQGGNLGEFLSLVSDTIKINLVGVLLDTPQENYHEILQDDIIIILSIPDLRGYILTCPSLKFDEKIVRAMAQIFCLEFKPTSSAEVVKILDTFDLNQQIDFLRHWPNLTSKKTLIEAYQKAHNFPKLVEEFNENLKNVALRLGLYSTLPIIKEDTAFEELLDHLQSDATPMSYKIYAAALLIQRLVARTLDEAQQESLEVAATDILLELRQIERTVNQNLRETLRRLTCWDFQSSFEAENVILGQIDNILHKPQKISEEEVTPLFEQIKLIMTLISNHKKLSRPTQEKQDPMWCEIPSIFHSPQYALKMKIFREEIIATFCPDNEAKADQLNWENLFVSFLQDFPDHLQNWVNNPKSESAKEERRAYKKCLRAHIAKKAEVLGLREFRDVLEGKNSAKKRKINQVEQKRRKDLAERPFTSRRRSSKKTNKKIKKNSDT